MFDVEEGGSDLFSFILVLDFLTLVQHSDKIFRHIFLFQDILWSFLFSSKIWISMIFKTIQNVHSKRPKSWKKSSIFWQDFPFRHIFLEFSFSSKIGISMIFKTSTVLRPRSWKVSVFWWKFPTMFSYFISRPSLEFSVFDQNWSFDDFQNFHR